MSKCVDCSRKNTAINKLLRSVMYMHEIEQQRAVNPFLDESMRLAEIECKLMQTE